MKPFNIRLTDLLKSQIERASSSMGMSQNAYIVGAVQDRLLKDQPKVNEVERLRKEGL